MRVKTLEIRWHDSKPISTCDFQPLSFKKARPAADRAYAQQSYRLATGGEDNHVRVWLVHPNILPPSVIAASTSGSDVPPVPRPPRVEYVATLSRHSAAVNVVRFSPNGDLLASAGDDGMIIIWAPSASAHNVYGSDTVDEQQYEKEHWKPRTTFRCSTMQVYDLAWSPTGEYIITGSTDNTARIFSAADGKCIHEIAEHNHFVQGVAWDPLNEFIATQSSDRSMHVYSITHKHGGNLEIHALGKNVRLPYRHTRTPSQTRTTPSRGRPHIARRLSTASETESIATSFSEQTRDDFASLAGFGFGGASSQVPQISTPATSVATTPITNATMFPPPVEKAASSRRSSVSAPGSPAHSSRYGRSPSPMPALPAIRALPANAWSSVRLYGDESFTNFFRRLTFSPDGGLLLTPAGQFEDPSITVGSSSKTGKTDDPLAMPLRGSGKLSLNLSEEVTNPSSASSVYIYSRANFARPPIAQLPGHKKASVAVKFSPILYELRQGVAGSHSEQPKTILLEKGKDETVHVDLAGPEPPLSQQLLVPSGSSTHDRSSSQSQLHSPVPLSASSSTPMLSPALSAVDGHRPATPSRRGRSAVTTSTSSVFALPYRMLFAVATMDTVAIHDTQQAGPICLLTKLHYDEFTDMTWSPDGQCLILSSRDGYCTIVVFDSILPAHHTQQHSLQMQSIAHQHSVPITTSSSGTIPTPMTTPSLSASRLPSLPPSGSLSGKRREPSVTPSATAEEGMLPTLNDASSSSVVVDKKKEKERQKKEQQKEKQKEKEQEEPPKKKRRVALTRVGDVGS